MGILSILRAWKGVAFEVKVPVLQNEAAAEAADVLNEVRNVLARILDEEVNFMSEVYRTKYAIQALALNSFITLIRWVSKRT